MQQQFVMWEVRVTSPQSAEIAGATAFEAGASGLEELPSGMALRVFAPEAAAKAIEAALGGLGALGVAVGPQQLVPDTDWSTAWREGLEAIRIAGGLTIRPPWIEDPDPGTPCLVIEPGQAFGTGGHASTRLALEFLLDLAWNGRRLLDVGTGSGVLALAALRLGAAGAVAFDLDPLAAPAARQNGLENGCASRLRLFTGPLDALAPGRAFDVVVANMIRTEQEPILAELLSQTQPRGIVILSGLLQSEDDRMTGLLLRLGFRVVSRRGELDERGDAWLALRAERA